MNRHLLSHIVLPTLVASTAVVCAAGQGQNEPGWWLTPHRLLQTNLWISLLNHSGHLDNITHPPIPIHNVEISLKTDRPVRRVISLTNGEDLTAFGAAAQTVSAVLPRIKAFEIVLVEYAP